jgi:predicted acetyltransferase
MRARSVIGYEIRMASLIAPTAAVHGSFLAAMAEFRAEGRGGPDDETMIGYEFRTYGERWHDPAGFAAYVRWLTDQARDDSSPPPGLVPSTTLWWVDGSEYLGRIAIRHRLTPRLRAVGGHVGYDVRPSARRRGHATAMLGAGLAVARRLGIDPAMIMCDPDNTASRRVIERHGGRLFEQDHAKLRYWVPTS